MSSTCTKTADVFGLHYLELVLKKGTTILHLFGQRAAIFRRPTFQHIEDIDLFARKSTGLYDFRQQLSGTTNKGDA